VSETTAANADPKASAWRTAAAAWWRGLAARERRLLAVGGAVLVLGLLWAWAVQPAWRTLQQAPAQLEVLDTQLQGMRALASEAEQLRATPAVSSEQAAAVLKAAVDRLGAKAKLSLQGDRAVLTLTALEPSALTSWLSEVRSGARARPLEANLTRSGAGYSGTLVLGLGSAP
jgi:general secretion pathway protein M